METATAQEIAPAKTAPAPAARRVGFVFLFFNIIPLMLIIRIVFAKMFANKSGSFTGKATNQFEITYLN